MDAGDSNAVLIRRLILTNVGCIGSVGSQYDRWTGNIANVHFTGGIAEVEDIVGNQAGIALAKTVTRSQAFFTVLSANSILTRVEFDVPPPGRMVIVGVAARLAKVKGEAPFDVAN